jgi:hypothetical protein
MRALVFHAVGGTRLMVRCNQLRYRVDQVVASWKEQAQKVGPSPRDANLNQPAPSGNP